MLVDATTGQILGKEDLLRYADARGRVFEPNPCVTLRDTALRDADDAQGAVGESAYKEVTLQGLDGSGRLRGEYVDVSGSTGGAAEEPTGVYDYRSFGYVEQRDLAVTIEEDQTSTLSVTLVRAGQVSLKGRVTRSDSGEPVAARVTLKDVPVEPVSTDADGRFTRGPYPPRAIRVPRGSPAENGGGSGGPMAPRRGTGRSPA